MAIMRDSHHPLPAFSPLERVVVVGEPPLDPSESGVLGKHGIILWRSALYVEQSRFGASGWLYVVYFPAEDAYDGVAESRLAATGEEVPLASCLGREFEISYDRDGLAPEAIAGTFRIPGGFWNTFVFRRAPVADMSYQIRIPVRFCPRGIAKYDFTVPETILLDSEYVEEVMSTVFDAKRWQSIAGPESKWLD